MPRDGKPTRDKILKHSKDLVLERGFSGMSIDMIIERAGISKGTFLYHFKTKNDLAKGLMAEYIAQDTADRTNALKDVGDISDPKERLLAFIQVFIDQFDKLKEPFSGCLYASFSYESMLFSKEIIQDISNSFYEWQITLEEMLDEMSRHYQPAIEVDQKELALLLSTIFEGAFVVSKAINNASVVPEHLRQYRNYIDLLYVKKLG